MKEIALLCSDWLLGARGFFKSRSRARSRARSLSELPRERAAAERAQVSRQTDTEDATLLTDHTQQRTGESLLHFIFHFIRI